MQQISTTVSLITIGAYRRLGLWWWNE